MRVIILLRRVFIIFITLLISSAVSATVPEVPSVSAQAAVVMDAASGKVFYRKNDTQGCAIASTTKIMTCLLACESGQMDDTVTITEAMLAGIEGTSINLKPSDTVTLLDLVKGAMLESGNDAANAIAFYLGGSIADFVAQMNARAAALGMKHTCFVTPSGLDSGDHHSTAYDMALLTQAALQNETLSTIAAERADSMTVSGNTVKLTNHNKLLQQDSAFTGFKTGYTKKAGRCLVSTYRYHDRDIICVTLHSPDDWNDHIKLMDYAKTQYRQLSECVNVTLPLVGSAQSEVRCAYRYDVCVCDDWKVREYYFPFVYAPTVCQQVVGYADVTDQNGTLLQRVYVTVQEDINDRNKNDGK